MPELKCNICGKGYKKDGWLWKHKHKLDHFTNLERMMIKMWEKKIRERHLGTVTAVLRAINFKSRKPIKVGEGKTIKFSRYNSCPN